MVHLFQKYSTVYKFFECTPFVSPHTSRTLFQSKAAMPQNLPITPSKVHHFLSKDMPARSPPRFSPLSKKELKRAVYDKTSHDQNDQTEGLQTDWVITKLAGY